MCKECAITISYHNMFTEDLHRPIQLTIMQQDKESAAFVETRICAQGFVRAFLCKHVGLFMPRG